jgi:hypothetical protein
LSKNKIKWCCICKKSGEFIDHLLPHCEMTRELWVVLFRLFRVEWIMPRKVIDVLNSWRGLVGRRNILDVWRVAHLCLMWCIWRERNARSFKYCKRSVKNLNPLCSNPFMHGWRRMVVSQNFGHLFFFFSL